MYYVLSVSGCLQSYLYTAGPLSVEDCHNYACQLFEALEFLHQKINIVHADIKRESHTRHSASQHSGHVGNCVCTTHVDRKISAK